jgi:hypothetical protein
MTAEMPPDTVTAAAEPATVMIGDESDPGVH